MAIKELQFSEPTSDDLQFIAENMRDEDAIEVYAAGAKSIIDELQQSACGGISVVAKDNGVPLVIYGCKRTRGITGSMKIWMLGTKQSEKYKKELLVYTRKVIDNMLKMSPHLYNYMHTKNIKSMRLLKRLGFTFTDEIVMPTGEKFVRFYKERLYV